MSGGGGILGDSGRQQMYDLLPHTRALHPDSHFQIYREFKPREEKVEITVFYREPGKDKMRIDAEFDEDCILDDLGPHNIRITYWGNAVRAVL